MSNLVRKDIDLEQYQCDKCERFFYINKMDKSAFDIEFGCPFGCDDAGILTRTLHAEIKEVTEEAG